MTRSEILQGLSREKEHLRALGVRRLSLFGSAARGEETSSSDLDFLVEFDRKTFRNYMELLRFLEGRSGRPVDLVIREALKPALRERVLREAIDVEGL
jgi:hypothetical protein